MAGWQKAALVVLMLYVLYQIYVVMALTFLYPIGSAYDEIVVFAAKAKVFFYEESIRSLKHLSMPSYPLMGSMQMLWVAVNLGFWDEILIKSLFPVMYVSFVVFQFYFFREKCGRFWAAVGVALTLGSNMLSYHASIGYQDFMVMVFNSTALMLMLMYYRQGKGALLTLAGVCAGFGVFAKLEGTAFWAINGVLCMVLLRSMPQLSFCEQIKRFAAFVLPGAIVYALYRWFVASQGLVFGEGRLDPKQYELASYLLVILNSHLNTMFLYNNWNVLWVLLGCSVLAFRRGMFKDFEVLFLTAALVLSMVMCVGVDLFTNNCTSLDSVLSRVFLHFYPLVPTLIVFLHFNGFQHKASP